MLKNSFKLEKLNILAYKEIIHENKVIKGESIGTFEAMFNPESYSLKYENVYQKYQGINTTGRRARYSLSKPQNLSLKLILDDTGVADYGDLGLATASLVGSTKDIYQQVNHFLKLTTEMNGDIHQPNFLEIRWGNLTFDCRLQSVEVNYTLFNRSGKPIRAELNTVFIEDIPDEKRIKQEKKTSPDLSHSRTIKSGNKLPLMAQEIYGDSAYYIQLARANNLNNFRKLKTGKTIKFPPIKK